MNRIGLSLLRSRVLSNKHFSTSIVSRNEIPVAKEGSEASVLSPEERKKCEEITNIVLSQIFKDEIENKIYFAIGMGIFNGYTFIALTVAAGVLVAFVGGTALMLIL